MFGEIVNLLADKPEKLEKVFIRGVKFILCIILAARLYKLIVGPYSIFLIDDYKQWTDFLLSGRVLICLLFYFISDYILVNILNALSYLFVNWVARWKAFKIDNSDILEPLKFFDIVKANPSEKVPLPGRNINILYQISQVFADEDSVEEIKTLKNTIIENILNLYVLFILVYFFILNQSIHSTSLNLFILGGFLIVLIAYIAIHSLIEFMVENHEKIFANLSFIKTYHKVIGFLNSNGIFPENASKETGLSKFKVFNCRDKEYVLVFTFYGVKVNLEEVQKLLSKKGKQNRIFILIAPKPFISDTFKLLLSNFESLITIEYTDEKNLEDQLRNTIDSIKQ